MILKLGAVRVVAFA